MDINNSSATKKTKQDIDHDGMVDEILSLAKERNWSKDLVETCLDALASKPDDYRFNK